MSRAALRRARLGDEQAFRELIRPYRAELQVHCYRMLGSLEDAEDALQETLVSAWRALERFEERASLRAWLYRIATNRCLNFLRDRGRRPRSEAPLPFDPPTPSRLGEVTWLQPFPNQLLAALRDPAPDPAARAETREAISLAYITALQRLPARQRAVLVLRDVLGFHAAEVAQILDASEASINSALHRARSALEARLPPSREHAPLPGTQHEQELAETFADAFENGDMDRVVSLLTHDAWLTMPPEPHEYQGQRAIRAFLHHVTARRRAGGGTRLIPTRANGQPALAHYLRDLYGDTAQASGLFVLTIEGDRISAITRFGRSQLLARFGLPTTIPW